MTRRSAALVPIASLIGLLLIVDVAAAQGLVEVTQFGTREYDEAWSAAWAGDDLIVTGQTWGRISGPEQLGGGDAFVRRMMTDGTKVWSKQFGSRREDVAVMAVTTDTAIYVVGNTLGKLPGMEKVGVYDVFIRKYDLAGTAVWTRQFGTERSEFAADAAVVGGNLFVVMTTYGRFPGETVRGGGDVAVAAYGPGGGQLWVNQFGTTGEDDADTIEPSGANAVITGSVAGTLAGERSRGRDAFARMIDADGNVVWTSVFGTRNFDVGYDSASDGTTVFVGGATAGEFADERARGGIDGFVRAFDATDGTRLWTQQFGTRKDDFGVAVNQDAEGVYVTGWTFGEFRGLDGAGGTDVFTLELALADGARVWTQQFGTPKDDFADWAELRTGTLAISGTTLGTFDGETKAGGYDAYFATFSVVET